MNKKVLNAIILCIFVVVIYSMRTSNTKDNDTIYENGYSAGSESAYNKGYDDGYNQAESEAEERLAESITIVTKGIRETIFNEDYPLVMDYGQYLDAYRWKEYIGEITEENYYYNLGLAFEENVVPESDSVKEFLNDIIKNPLDYYEDWAYEIM